MKELYDLAEQYRELAQLSDGEIPREALEDTMEAIEGEFNEKAVVLHKQLLGVEGEVEAIDREIGRLMDRKQALKNNVQRGRDWLKRNMRESGISKISCPLFTITLCKPGTKVEVTDNDLLPDDYVEVSHNIRPDKKKIGAALRAGKKVPGAELVESEQSLKIK